MSAPANTSRTPARSYAAPDLNRLPPYDESLERAVLGAVLYTADQATPAMNGLLERFGAANPFYDLRHADIWRALKEIHGEGKTPDLITLQARLRDAGKLEEVGGLAYLSVISDDSLPLDLILQQHAVQLWSKYLARLGLTAMTDWASRVWDDGELAPEALLEVRRRVEMLEAEASRHAANPRYLKEPGDFSDAFWAQFFGERNQGEPGRNLPIDFKLKIRPGETTLVTGDDGSGKSTVLGYFALHLMAQGEKVCIASLEMPPPVTLWILTSQLLAAKRQPESSEGQRRVKGALAWLHARLLLYDFLGIGDWRDLLDTFRFAAEKRGATVFILDSVMRIGIQDDDYALQGTVAAQFAQFAKAHKAHLFFVIHENKSDAKGKGRIRGSKLWSANADNVVRVERNMDKKEKASKVKWTLDIEKAQAERDEAEIRKLEKALKESEREWDTNLVLQKQRWPGSQQNASRRIWFDPENFQFRARHDDAAVNWLEQWNKRPEPKEIEN